MSETLNVNELETSLNKGWFPVWATLNENKIWRIDCTYPSDFYEGKRFIIEVQCENKKDMEKVIELIKKTLKNFCNNFFKYIDIEENEIENL